MKKIFILVCILVIFGTIANIYAEDNITDDTLNFSETTKDEIISIEENNNYSSSVPNDELSVCNEDELTLPSYNDYSASIITNGFSEGGLSTKIKVKLTPSSSSSKTYDFFLKIAKPNQIYKINQRFSGTIPSSGYVYLPIDTTKITSGLYEMSIINSNDGYIMDKSDLSVTGVSPFYDDYSVIVDNDFVNYDTKSSINLIINQASSKIYTHQYDFYLKVYDSNKKLKISEKFCSSQPVNPTKVYYYVTSGQLDVGDYTIKIINSKDEKVMFTKDFKVCSKYGYSINVDTQVSYEDGGYIKMNISSEYKYYIYDFDLKVYDSNKNLIICQRYSNNVPISNYEQQICIINRTQMASGEYSIEFVDKTPIIYFEDGITKEKEVIKGTANFIVSEKASNIINENINLPSSNQISMPNNIIKNNKISLTLKTVKIKKSAKKLVLQATLKKGKSLLINKKITFKFNGKTYKAKTNKKGIAKIIIKKSVLKKLKVGKKIKYQASYGKILAKKTAKVRK